MADLLRFSRMILAHDSDVVVVVVVVVVLGRGTLLNSRAISASLLKFKNYNDFSFSECTHFDKKSYKNGIFVHTHIVCAFRVAIEVIYESSGLPIYFLPF